MDQRTTGQPTSGRRGAVAVLCAVQVVDVLGVTVVTTALPAMLAGLDAPSSAAAPVLTGYAVLFGALLMLGARLGDRHGHRRVLQAGLVLFGVASVLAATAPSAPVLVAARCLQGASAAASVPAALRLLSAVARDEDARRRALAAWSAAGAGAGALGFLLGGALTDLAGWRSVFWVTVPVAAVLLLAVRRTAPHVPRERGGPLDAAGAVLLTGGIAALVLGASLLEAGDTRRAGALAIFATTATTSSAGALATLHLQQVRGVSPTATGLLLLPLSACVVLGAARAAPLLRRTTPRRTAGLGLLVVAAGDAALLAEPLGAWVLPGAVAVVGFGLGLASVGATTLGTSVPDALQGTAAGALNTAAQLGTALGVAAVLLLAGATAGQPSGLPLAGTPLGWTTAAAAAAVAALVLLRPAPRG